MSRHLVRLLLLSATFAAAACAAQSSPLETEVAVASPADVDAKEDSAHKDLTAKQKSEVLLQLNNICGDTWCDGDWWWTFKSITCKLDLDSCTWTAMIDPSVPAAGKVPVYWRSCKVTGLKKFSDLVTTTGGHQSINQTFYEASTDCVFKITPNLPPQ